MPGRKNFHLLYVWQGSQIERRCLIHKIIEPVGKQKTCVAAPAVEDFLAGIVVLKIMPGNLNGEVFLYIPKIFAGQRIPVVFRMAGDKKLSARFAGDQISARLFGGGQKSKLDRKSVV